MSDLADIDVPVRKTAISSSPGEQVTYRKDGASRMLVLMDSMRMDPDPERARFLVSAWRAGHDAKAQQLGWLAPNRRACASRRNSRIPCRGPARSCLRFSTKAGRNCRGAGGRSRNRGGTSGLAMASLQFGRRVGM